MTDILMRLLRQRDEYDVALDHESRVYGLEKSLEHAAADEIERLRAERDQLRAAILDTEQHDAGLVPMRLRLLARKETSNARKETSND
jgi:hypothetical protein